MKNRLVVGTIVGQAVVTLVAIAYGASAHSSWEAERQRRLDGERAAVTEMATAMQSARERLDKVERELKRCRARSRRAARVPAATAPAPADTLAAASPPTMGPIAWMPPGVEPRPQPVTAACLL